MNADKDPSAIRLKTEPKKGVYELAMLKQRTHSTEYKNIFKLDKGFFWGGGLHSAPLNRSYIIDN